MKHWFRFAYLYMQSISLRMQNARLLAEIKAHRKATAKLIANMEELNNELDRKL